MRSAAGRTRSTALAVLVALVASLVVSSPTGAAPGDTYTYAGTVTSQGGGPLAGMTVSLFDISAGSLNDPAANSARPWPVGSTLLSETTTDPSGAYTLSIVESVSPVQVQAVIVWDPASQHAVKGEVFFGYADRSGIDFELGDGGLISGVISSDGGPAPAIDYSLRDALELPSPFFAEHVSLGLVVGPGGAYTTPALPDGDYQIRYPDAQPPYVPVSYGTPLATVVGGADVVANHNVGQEAAMSGRVTDGSGAPLGGILVSASGSSIGVASGSGPVGGFAVFTDPNGDFAVDRLVPGDWTVQYLDRQGVYASEFYDDETFLANADAVVVPSGGATPGVDAALGLGGSITGHVLDTQGYPVQGQVSLCEDAPATNCTLGTSVDPAGQFTFEGLRPGTYFVEAYSYALNASQYYNGLNGPPATPIVLTEGQHLGAIDFAFAGGRIAGTVTDLSSNGVGGLDVRVYNGPVSYYGPSAETATDGTYLTGLLPPGAYELNFGNYAAWDDQPLFAGDSISVTAGATTSGVDAQFELGGIEGTVTSGGAALPDATVQAYGVFYPTTYPTVGFPSTEYVRTEPDGTYRVPAPAGDFSLSSRGQFHSNVAHPGQVAVTGTATTSGIDVSLPFVGDAFTPPSLVTITGSSGSFNGVPRFETSDVGTFSIGGCAGGFARIAITGSSDSVNLDMEESPSGVYSADVPMGASGLSNHAQVWTGLDCPDPIDNVFDSFNLFVDRPAMVVDEFGSPVSGAMVTLLRDDESTTVADFTAVTAGSALLNAAVNSANPVVVGSDGLVSWEAALGTYRLRAEAAGCHAPGDPGTLFVESLNVSEPAEHLGRVLTLECGAAPTVTAGAVLVSPEGDSGSSVWELPVTLSHPSASTVTVDWATTDIPANPAVAHPGSDYVASSGTVTFLPGETTQSVSIEVLGDTVDEPPALYGEWGLVTLSNPTNATVDMGGFFGLGVFIIIDDD